MKLPQVISLVLATAILATACTTARKKVKPEEPPVLPPVEVEPAVPKIVPKDLKPVTVILGPGMARGLTYAGVLNALKEAQIPIKAVIGTGMGALVGALFATSTTTNDLEWKLLKVKRELFIESTSTFSRMLSMDDKAERMDETLEEILRDQQFSDLIQSLRVGILDEGKLEQHLISTGGIADAVRASMALSGIRPSVKWKNATARSSATVRAFPVRQVKRLIGGPVIVVDVLDSKIPWFVNGEREKYFAMMMADAKLLAKRDLNSADIVIRPDLEGLGYFDFDKRSSFVFRGKQAVQRDLIYIKEKLIGRSKR